jgi:DNA-binding NarL/FixJ family response regulator
VPIPVGEMLTKTMRETREAAAIAARAALSVLIVDDEAHVRMYSRLMLKALGVTTIWEAGTGADGLALYLEHRPSVVLMDVNMPTMTGDVMMARLTAIDPDAAVIVMTSESQAGVVNFFQELGAIGYVLKQLPREKAMAMIAESLDCLLETDENVEG